MLVANTVSRWSFFFLTSNGMSGPRVRYTVPCGLLRYLHPHLHTLAGRWLSHFPSWNGLRGSQLMDRDESFPRKPRLAQAFVKNRDHIIDGSIC